MASQRECNRLGAQILDTDELFGDCFGQINNEDAEGVAFDIIVVQGPDGNLYQNSDFLVAFRSTKKENTSIVLKVVGDEGTSATWFRIHEGCDGDNGKHDQEEESSMGALRAILKPGKNPIVYYLLENVDETSYTDPIVLGAARANIFLWNHTDSIVVSDIDGTITKSNVKGGLGTLLTNNYEKVSHDGICHMLHQLTQSSEDNHRRVVYLTSRPIDFANKTRAFLSDLRQSNQSCLPSGPILGFGGHFGQTLHMEVVTQDTQKFKANKLRQQIVRPFRRAASAAPEFVAAFGNNLKDVQAYHSIGIHLSKIFMIDKKSIIETFHEEQADRQTPEESLNKNSTTKHGGDDDDFPPHSWYEDRKRGTKFNGYTDAKLHCHIGLFDEDQIRKICTTGTLTVYLVKALHLPNKQTFGTSDPYVTLTLKNVRKEREVGRTGGGDVGQFKSEIIKSNLNPSWGETFVFDNVSQMLDHQLYMSVKDDNVLKDTLMGKCEINLWQVDGLAISADDPILIAQELDQGCLYVKLSWKGTL